MSAEILAFEAMQNDRSPDEPTLVVDVEGYEGPLDLLLALARHQKVDLAKISILALADQYLTFIEAARKLRLEVAADYLEELLDIADLDGDIDTYVENGRAHVSVITDSDVLVGKDGEVLEALQELARLAVITETGNRSRLMLDVGGFRERRRKELNELAADAVEEAKSSGEPVRLKPMNPFERKIVHDVVAAAGLTSESEGEEPQRRVVIQPNACVSSRTLWPPRCSATSPRSLNMSTY